MDAKPSQLASEPLNYQTWFLKVSIHCEGCTRKVKKVLKRIDGVFTATIDPQQHKATVTGTVGVETLLRELVRAGKHAEIWPENLEGDGKNSSKDQKKKKKKKKNEVRKAQSLQNKGAAKCKSDNKSSSSNSKARNKSPGKSMSGCQVPPENGRKEDGCGYGKKKKKKEENGGGSSCLSAAASTGAAANTGLQFEDLLSLTRQQLLPYPETDYAPMVYVSGYNRFYPSFSVPSSPYTCAALDHDSFQFQPTPLVSFEIFSDENANGCYVM